MVFGIVMDVVGHIKSLRPAFLSKKPHFTFITVHYFWILLNAIVCSIMIYPAGGLAYIDALFLSSGAATQSGLNTIDINLLNTYQQLVLFFIAMLANPITINTFVVFLRLYWFEKRFQHIAREARNGRRSIGKNMSKSRSQARPESDLDNEEKGVNGRQIVVMHNTTRAHGSTDGVNGVDMAAIHAEKPVLPKDEQTGFSSSSEGEVSQKSSLAEQRPTVEGTNHPSITFADKVSRSDGIHDLRVPYQRTKEEHLAILERQRNPEDKGVLRIPGPRDQERGLSPQEIEQEVSIAQNARRHSSSLGVRRSSTNSRMGGNRSPERALNDDDHEELQQHPPKRTITIAEPSRPSHVSEHLADDTRAAAHTLGAIRFRKPRVMYDNKDHDTQENPHLHKARSRAMSFSGLRSVMSAEKSEEAPYLSWEPTIGRNSAFVDLDQQQREELGGIEYRSLKTLALILVLYFWGFTLLGVISLTPWIILNDTWGQVVDSDGQNRAWWGIFTAVSAFNDLGYTLTPDSMVSFQNAIWPLLIMSFLIVIGNTAFPIMLRFIIWATTLWIPKGSGIWEELRFLLDHPRRCFTLMFPSKATWWLFWILVILNGTDLILFIILDLGNTIVTQLPVNLRVLNGWFQAVSTRTAGFACVNLAELHPAIQVSYMVMMYISVLPIAISVRRTNVYEEKSLGIWGGATDENEDEKEASYVGAHLRRQLSFDLWYIFLGLFIIAIAEGPRLQSSDPNDAAFTMFAVLFEVVSAYGTVGLSLGYTNINASFSAEFGIVSKLVIIAMQIRGRHRGLPYELDRAILLPSESLQEKEHDDATMRARRRGSTGTMDRPMSRSSTRAKSRDRNGPSLLASLLHPGPTIPNSHRNVNFNNPTFADRGRTQSIASQAVDDRSASPSPHVRVRTARTA